MFGCWHSILLLSVALDYMVVVATCEAALLLLLRPMIVMCAHQ
jgi:hypothetical protein